MPEVKTKEGKMYLRIRNACGILGIILPYVCLFSASLCEHPGPEWWYSISATYYQTPAMVALLLPACVVMICYIGYDKRDNIVTTLSGISGILLAMFPCSVNWLPAGTRVGFFHIPMEVSNICHFIAGLSFFFLLGYNSFFLFTKSSKDEMSEGKKFRNKIYRFCGAGMLIVGLAFAALRIAGAPGYVTIFAEIILLNLFGLSWLVKGQALRRFKRSR